MRRDGDVSAPKPTSGVVWRSDGDRFAAKPKVSGRPLPD